MEMLLFSLIAAWVSMRYIGGDAVAAVRGTESARTRDRRAREQIAAERVAAGRGPSVGQALADRVAHRIANPPVRGPRGPAREALARWWQDVWAEADRRRRARAETRRPPRQPYPAPPPRVDDDLDDDGVIDAEIVDDPAPADVEPDGCDDPPVSLTKQPDPPPPPAEHPEPDAPESPGATVHPIRGDQTMTTTSDISGETLDPAAAAAFAQQCGAAAEELFRACEQSAASLRERGVAGAPIEEIEAMQEQFSIAADRARQANAYFLEHVGKQQDLAADEQLAGTVTGTYLGSESA